MYDKNSFACANINAEKLQNLLLQSFAYIIFTALPGGFAFFPTLLCSKQPSESPFFTMRQTTLSSEQPNQPLRNTQQYLSTPRTSRRARSRGAVTLSARCYLSILTERNVGAINTNKRDTADPCIMTVIRTVPRRQTKILPKYHRKRGELAIASATHPSEN